MTYLASAAGVLVDNLAYKTLDYVFNFKAKWYVKNAMKNQAGGQVL